VEAFHGNVSVIGIPLRALNAISTVFCRFADRTEEFTYFT
jgi:hypothetical protein